VTASKDLVSKMTKYRTMICSVLTHGCQNGDSCYLW